MASIITCFSPLIINLIFIILPLSNIARTCGGGGRGGGGRGGGGRGGGGRGGDLVGFERWLAWHAQEYQRNKAINNDLSSESLLMNHQKNGGSMIDKILEIAEKNKSRIIVSQDGKGDVKTIKEAIDLVPKHNTNRVILEIKPGTYWEKIVIPKSKPFVTFEGSLNNFGEAAVTIIGNASRNSTGKTYHSATIGINSDYFEASNIKFENTFEHVEGADGGQAVALRISGTKASFQNCSFHGYQDTLYDHKGLHYFNNCFIQGSVDFIFGNAKSLYENCSVHSIANKTTALTAQKRLSAYNDTGFSFKNCNVSGNGPAYLGRAWGNFSRVVYSYSFMEQLVIPKGWDAWNKPETQLYYGEYKCSGPGANTSSRVAWARQLTHQQAIPFLGPHFINANTWLFKPQHI